MLPGPPGGYTISLLDLVLVETPVLWVPVCSSQRGFARTTSHRRPVFPSVERAAGDTLHRWYFPRVTDPDVLSSPSCQSQRWPGH
jgi:hypothetical protein